MKKVKVRRYVSGKRPDYARAASSEEKSEDEDFLDRCINKPHTDDAYETNPNIASSTVKFGIGDDQNHRLGRLIRLEKHREVEEDVRAQRRLRIHEPEIVEAEPERPQKRIEFESSDLSEDEYPSESEMERRREVFKARVLSRKEAKEELINKDEEEMSDSNSEESSEYEEYTDSEEETGPRLKPVFVRRKARITVMEKEKKLVKKAQDELEKKKMSDERKLDTLRMVEDFIRQETQSVKATNKNNIEDVCTDDENDEVEFECWKLRELKRIKRDDEERKNLEKERLEMERVRNLSEEERRQEARINPKVVTNNAAKGTYKFLQKYYHRGAFYLDRDETVFKRDFSGATLEDHFDKTILPKVMQVKNFGRSGRTKYTHLVDQDTTQFDSRWISENGQILKFHKSQSAGVKQVFDKPPLKKFKNN